jgi:hypothetical protein
MDQMLTYQRIRIDQLSLYMGLDFPRRVLITQLQK